MHKIFMYTFMPLPIVPRTAIKQPREEEPETSEYKKVEGSIDREEDHLWSVGPLVQLTPGGAVSNVSS